MFVALVQLPVAEIAGVPLLEAFVVCFEAGFVRQKCPVQTGLVEFALRHTLRLLPLKASAHFGLGVSLAEIVVDMMNQGIVEAEILVVAILEIGHQETASAVRLKKAVVDPSLDLQDMQAHFVDDYKY